MKLGLKVIPGARSDEVVGWYGDRLKVKVRAAPEKGAANKAVERLLAAVLDLPAQAVSVDSGHGTPLKTITIDGLSAEVIHNKLAQF